MPTPWCTCRAGQGAVEGGVPHVVRGSGQLRAQLQLDSGQQAGGGARQHLLSSAEQRAPFDAPSERVVAVAPDGLPAGPVAKPVDVDVGLLNYRVCTAAGGDGGQSASKALLELLRNDAPLACCFAGAARQQARRPPRPRRSGSQVVVGTYGGGRPSREASALAAFSRPPDDTLADSAGMRSTEVSSALLEECSGGQGGAGWVPEAPWPPARGMRRSSKLSMTVRSPLAAAHAPDLRVGGTGHGRPQQRRGAGNLRRCEARARCTGVGGARDVG